MVMDGLPSSIFVDESAPVYDMPVSAISRPLASMTDPEKVQLFVEEMKVCSSIRKHCDNSRFASTVLRQCMLTLKLLLQTGQRSRL